MSILKSEHLNPHTTTPRRRLEAQPLKRGTGERQVLTHLPVQQRW